MIDSPACSRHPPDQGQATGDPNQGEPFAVDPQGLGKPLQAVRSAPFFCEFLHPLAGKGQAVRALCRQLTIPASDVIGIGDADNDTDLVRWAGLGIAMGNATESLLAVADHVTASNEDDGLAKAIRRFVLADPPCSGKLKPYNGTVTNRKWRWKL